MISSPRVPVTYCTFPRHFSQAPEMLSEQRRPCCSPSLDRYQQQSARPAVTGERRIAVSMYRSACLQIHIVHLLQPTPPPPTSHAANPLYAASSFAAHTQPWVPSAERAKGGHDVPDMARQTAGDRGSRTPTSPSTISRQAQTRHRRQRPAPLDVMQCLR